MSKRYVVKPLGEGQVLQAYPLVQTAVPHVTLEEWVRYAEELRDRQHLAPGCAGVMSAQNPDGYIYGIYCHEVESTIKHGRILKVTNLVTANLYDSSGIMDRMIDSMHDKARDSGCVAVHVELPEEVGMGPRPVGGAVSMLRSAGYRVAAVALRCPIEEK